MLKNKKIIFIASGLDFHALDWYRNILSISNGDREIKFATDIIQSEGHLKLINEKDEIISLFNIDLLLFRKESDFGNIWRNIVKLIFFPLQIFLLRRLAKKNPNSIFHAHSMYYMFLSWGAGIKYIGSPQGAEILVRPFTSKIYRFFAIKCLKAADNIIIDSFNLKDGIMKLAERDSNVVQYGIDYKSICNIVNTNNPRTIVSSIRAIYPIYRIEKIIEGRNNYDIKQPLLFYYPYWEESYLKEIMNTFSTFDINKGRLGEKSDVFKILSESKLAISIPKYDSSPRSVYEAIFCGCCVAVPFNNWIDNIPESMLKRVFIVDLDDESWFSKAIQFADSVSKTEFIPCEEALNKFDQDRSMSFVIKNFY
jgi:hypothetical protein